MNRFVSSTLAGLCLLSAPPASSATPASPATNSVRNALSSLSVPFIVNAGQFGEAIRFHAPVASGGVFVTNDGALIHAFGVIEDHKATGSLQTRSTRSVTLRESFVGGHSRPEGARLSATNVSFLVGDPAAHRPHVPAYDRVELGEVFPGVNVTLHAVGRNVEKLFTVAPGIDPAVIAMALDGATNLAAADDGALVVGMPGGSVTFTPPVAWQQIDGERRPVAVTYAIDKGAMRYGFRVGAHDRSKPLVIDPLLQSTFLGGNNEDILTAVAIHPTSGEVYVLGQTLSTNLSCTTTDTAGCQNGVQEDAPGGRNCYLARLNSTLTTLLQATYLGGSADEVCREIAFSPNGSSVYVSGTTQSTNPLGPGVQQANNGIFNAFVARVVSALTGLQNYTFYGSTGSEKGNAMAIHPASGDVFLAGTATSSSGLLGINANSAQPARSGSSDGFVVRFSPALDAVIQATYLGGTSSVDIPEALAYNALTDELYVAGGTQSDDFPVLTGGALSAVDPNISQAGFVARLSGNLRAHRQSTLVGGFDSFSSATTIALNPATNDVYVGGGTQSFFLVGAGSGAQAAHDPANNTNDAYITRFDWALKTLFRSTYFGGDNLETVSGLAVHPVTREIYLAGRTYSSNLPGTASGVQPTRQGTIDGFIARFSPDLSLLVRATYFGGGSDDGIGGIAIHPVTGDLYAAGNTTSATLPQIAGGAQATRGLDPAGEEGMIVRLTADLTVADTTPAPFAFAPKPGVPLATVQTSNPVLITGIGGSANVYVLGSPNSAYCVSTTNSCSCDLFGGFFIPVPGSVSNGRYVCVRHTSAQVANQITSTTLYVGAQAATFNVSTGSPLGAGCTLDVDGNSAIDALTDGLMLIRAMFGLTGTTVTNNAIGGGSPTRTTWAQIQPYLNGNCGTSFAP